MRGRKSFLQKMIITLFITIIMCNILLVPVHAFPLKGSSIENNPWVGEGQMFKTFKRSNGVTYLYYVFDYAGEKHAVRLTESGVDGSNLEEIKVGEGNYRYYPEDSYDYLMDNEPAYRVEGTEPYTEDEIDEGKKRFDEYVASLGNNGYVEVRQDPQPGQIAVADIDGPEVTNEDAAYEGGIILRPILDLITSLGDVVINILQKVVVPSSTGSITDSLFSNEYLTKSSKYEEKPTTSESEVTIEVDADKFEKSWLMALVDFVTGKGGGYLYPNATYSPEEIFSGKIENLNVNFFKDSNDEQKTNLQNAIASWYVALRNLSIVGLLSVLVYIGIRIIISSAAKDKAKYKQMLLDWLIALCLLFFMHYIMTFTVTIIDSICDGIGGSQSSSVLVKVSNRRN